MSGRIDGMGGLMNSISGRVARKFIEDQAPNWAALIAWNTLFAMFPIAVVMVVLFTILVVHSVATSAILPALKHITNEPDFMYSGVATFILQAIVRIPTAVTLFGSIY